MPFFLFGIPDTTSNEWRNLVRVGERILSKPEEASVTVIAPDPDHIEVRVAMGDVPIAAQILTRSRTSGDYAEGISGQGDRSFRCELDRVVVVGAYVCDWEAYRLPIETKRARYRRPGKNDVGTARGYFDFLRAADGSLVMRQRLYLSIGCDGLDERWRRWEPAPGQPANPR